MVKVLFVCLGNICRSPTAEGVFRTLIAHENLDHAIEIDSAGTAAWHIGKSPDARSQDAARARGVDLSQQRARQTSKADFDKFDYVLAMDRDNHAELSVLCPPDYQGTLSLFLDFAPEADTRDVPDPYYGGDNGFEIVLDLIEAASKGLLDDIRKNHPL